MGAPHYLQIFFYYGVSDTCIGCIISICLWSGSETCLHTCILKIMSENGIEVFLTFSVNSITSWFLVGIISFDVFICCWKTHHVHETRI